ncbi:hypothetical protein HU200_012704 [Digitaria exilis]|uniref:Uncharacterized protein n=1 Tax=Digitaria exilis TaxID=1010633 RepID=A0A835KLN8_9POAL|nr:hypothetical protein HU200_012704 [Digitaria exilis]
MVDPRHSVHQCQTQNLSGAGSNTGCAYTCSYAIWVWISWKNKCNAISKQLGKRAPRQWTWSHGDQQHYRGDHSNSREELGLSVYAENKFIGFLFT